MTTSNIRGWQATVGLAVVSALILGTTLCTMGMFLAPVMEAFDSVSMAAGPLVTGHLYDATNSYTEPFLLCSLLMTLAAIPVSLLGAQAKAGTQRMVSIKTNSQAL